MSEENAVDGAPFETNLQKLLSRAYDEPAYRPEFRRELLGRLKQRQTVQVSRRRRGTVIRLAVWSSAAAATLTISLLPGAWRGNPAAVKPAPEIGVTQAREEVKPENIAVAMAKPTAAAVVPVSAAVAQPAQVSGAVRVRDQAGRWLDVADQGTFDLAAVSEIGVSRESGEVSALKLADGSLLVLKPGSQLARSEAGLRVMNGSVLIRRSVASSELGVDLPDCRIALKPGSEVFFKVPDARGYAPGGAPVPSVVVLGGEALAQRGNGSGSRLEPGRAYQLYDFVTGDLPGRTLDPREQQDFSNLIHAVKYDR